MAITLVDANSQYAAKNTGSIWDTDESAVAANQISDYGGGSNFGSGGAHQHVRRLPAVTVGCHGRPSVGRRRRHLHGVGCGSVATAHHRVDGRGIQRLGRNRLRNVRVRLVRAATSRRGPTALA